MNEYKDLSDIYSIWGYYVYKNKEKAAFKKIY
jgi:hypothetical protein